MKFGIYFAYWEHEWRGDYIHYTKKVSDLGFDVMDISAGQFVEFNDAQIKELKDCAADHNLILGLNHGPSRDQDPCDPSVRNNMAEFYKVLFDKANKAGINKIGGALYSSWPADYSKPFDKAEHWKNSVEGMKIICDIAKDAGVAISLEALNRFEGYLLNTSKEGVQYIEEVGRDNLFLLLDTFHMSIEEANIPAAIRYAGKHLGYMHVGESNRRVPGKGAMPWADIAHSLKEIGYDGTIVMEPFVMMGGGVGKDVHIWHPIEDDISEEALDRDAKGALNFLRHVMG